jgi:RNA polymerase sigma-70 factor, ECF subfamily
MDFAGLYRRHAPDVFRFALYLSGTYAQAQDLAAETFSRAWIARNQIRVGTVKAYLFMIARNLYRDQMKTRVARAARTTEEPPEWWPDTAADPETSARHKQRLRVVLAALHRLPEQDRAALTMAAIDGLPYEQIAAVLDVSVGAVKVRVHRARVKLNRLLDAKEQP